MRFIIIDSVSGTEVASSYDHTGLEGYEISYNHYNDSYDLESVHPDILDEVEEFLGHRANLELVVE